MNYSPFTVKTMPELTKEESLRLNLHNELRVEKNFIRARRLSWRIAKSYLRDGKRESAAITLGCHKKIGL